MSEAPEPIEIASLTDVGLQREQNQDCFGEWSHPDGRHLLVVADGMGGHRGGATASRMAIDAIGQLFQELGGEPAESLLRYAFAAANRAIHDASCADLSLRGMGTTGVALLLEGPPSSLRAWAAHVGDSRLYRFRDQRLERLTRDHNLRTDLIERGKLSPEEVEALPDANALLRALGIEPQVDVELQEVSIRPGDVFLLCSDGLWGLLPDAAIGSVLERYRPEDAARILVDEANRCGGSDNITVQIAACSASSAVVAAQRPTRPDVAAVRRVGPSWTLRWLAQLAAGAVSTAALLIGGLLIAVRLAGTPSSAETPSAPMQKEMGTPDEQDDLAPPPPAASSPARVVAPPARRARPTPPRPQAPVEAEQRQRPAAASREPSPALRAALREHIAAYERALQACDAPALDAVASQLALLRAKRRCQRSDLGVVSLVLDEASLVQLAEGRFRIDLEEREGEQRSALRATLDLGQDGAWRITDLVLRGAPAEGVGAPAQPDR